MSLDPASKAFDDFLEKMGEDDADDLLGLAEISFFAGWNSAVESVQDILRKYFPEGSEILVFDGKQL